MLKSEAHHNASSVGIFYYDSENNELFKSDLQVLEISRGGQSIQEFYEYTKKAKFPHWNMVHFTLLGSNDELKYETWLDHRIDEEIRFYDAGGEVEEWQAIEDERDAYFQQGGGEEAWRSRIEQLISDRTA